MILLLLFSLQTTHAQKMALIPAVKKHFFKEIGINHLADDEYVEFGIISDDSTHYFAIQGKDSTWVANSSYEVGSCTKILTAYVVDQLVQKGKLSYADDISLYLPIPALKGFTIDDLLMHNTGLPKYPGMNATMEGSVAEPFAEFTEAYMKTYLAEITPQKTYSFSHANYYLLSKIIEQQSDFFETMQSELSHLSQTSPTKNTNKRFGGATGWESNTPDLLTILSSFIQQQNTGENQITISTPFKGIQFSRAWALVDIQIKNHPVIRTHSAKNDSGQLFMAMIPETRTGVIIYINSHKNFGTLGFDVLQLINQHWKKWDKL